MLSRAPCSTGAVNSHTQTFSTNCRTVHMCQRGLRVVGHAIAEPEVMAADPRLATTRVCVFSAQQYVRDFLEEPLKGTFPKSKFIEAKLDEETATMARGCKAVVAFVNDDCSAETLEVLAAGGTKVLAMRCAGYDRVDLEAASSLGISVLRVPTYSPHSVAEHAVALMFTLNRHLHRAYVRTIQGNYSLNGLVGYEMFKKTVGVVGTGAIGFQACRILQGIGCKVLAHDLHPNEELQKMGVTYMPLDEMLPLCDIVTLHCPLLPSTKHIINAKRLTELKPGAMLINVSRGGLVQSDALHDALENGQLGALGMDVYENEGDMFFVDHTQLDMKSRMKVWDRQFKSLLIYPQVMVTPHSAFLTQEALDNIAISTITNISNYVLEQPLGINEVKYKPT